MDKKWIIGIIFVVILGILLGIGLAIYSSNSKRDTEKMDIISEKVLANQNSLNNVNTIEHNTNALETSATKELVSPNAIIIEKIYYEECDHLIKKTLDIPEELVNKTEEDVEKYYSEWKVEKYSPKEITIYKTSAENCGEHYFVQEHNGVIGIYTTDKYGVKTLMEDTEIVTQYLPESDLKKLRAGIEIVGYTNLTEFLEDYE